MLWQVYALALAWHGMAWRNRQPDAFSNLARGWRGRFFARTCSVYRDAETARRTASAPAAACSDSLSGCFARRSMPTRRQGLRQVPALQPNVLRRGRRPFRACAMASGAASKCQCPAGRLAHSSRLLSALSDTLHPASTPQEMIHQFASHAA